MFGILSVEERENLCFDYFNHNGIETRDQLRDCWKTNPINGVRVKFAEEMFSDFQDMKRYREKRQQEIIQTSEYHQTFVLSDIHIPFHDEKSVQLVYDCLADFQPKRVVLLGDILDCYSISRFLKDPSRSRNLQEEIDIFYKYMKMLRKILPNTEIVYILGNHEARLHKLILENPGLYGLKALAPDKLFRLNELNIIFKEKKAVFDNFIFYHGDVVRKAAGYSAKAEYEDHRMKSGISGHTHRLSSYFSTYEKEAGQWYENGCLCELSPDYLNDPDKANWQQGFTVIDHYDGLNQGTQILIQDHKFSYGGRLYK